MSGTEVDLRDVLDGIDAMRAAARDLRPVFQELQPILRQDIKEHFEGQHGPDGNWAPLAASTIRKLSNRQMKFHGPTGRGRRGSHTKTGKLRASVARRIGRPLGRLRSAWKFTVAAQSLTATSRVDWSNVHQTGGVVGHGARLPARPFAFADDWLVDLAAHRIVDFIVRPWARGR